MLKYINYQLLDDEEQQKQLERAVAPLISRNIRQNIDAFRQYIPSALQLLEQHEVQQFSVFCTKEQQLNIVDFATGRVFYTIDPRQEVANELSQYFQQASYFCLKGGVDHLDWRHQSLPTKVDVMLVFGMGLGLHLLELISSSRIRFLVIYEPSLDVFACSTQAADWREILDTAQAIGTHIFLQIGSEANSLPAELQELLDFDPTINEIFVYRHQFHPMMDDVINYIMKNHGDSEHLLQTSHVFTPYNDYADYVAERAGNVLGTALISPIEGGAAQALYDKNMLAFSRFYPKVHKVLLEHKTRAWQLVVDPSGQMNLYHQQRRALFHLDLKGETDTLVDYFVCHPYKDDVVLNQRTGRKLSDYIHFSMVNRLQPLIERTLTKQSRLPKEVESLIIFGVALGSHIEMLSQQHQIKNLYICEPNIDYFSASLWVTDWDAIINKADESGGRLYLNLGGDGSHYFYDLMAQFYQVGAYSIADTYMLSTYYNIGMQKAIGELRSELKVVLALGEYFDHARYGIAHTYHSINNGHRFLKNDTKKFENHKSLNLPVFIVGNGPSLDDCYDYLREYRDKVILISCGTALRSLYRNGIQPDFHAEIEQNRATFDWITQIEDRDYLKKIRLISVNGIHPDTAELFRETLLCFKEGEASTYVFHNGMSKQGLKIASLAYAYPTVTNLVLNYILKLGFKQLYLFGVDLGFVDISRHHSSYSAYFKDDGSEIYNYQWRHGGGLPCAGNFRPSVFTKTEFDVSRKLLEQAIQKAGRKIDVYNCSDGVKIKGTISLFPQNILLNDSEYAIEEQLVDLIDVAFYSSQPEMADSIYQLFNKLKFDTTMKSWLNLIENDITCLDEAKSLIRQQWELVKKAAVVDSDLTFCLFHGSSNYISGILTKVASNIQDENEDFIQLYNDVLAVWRDYLTTAYEGYQSQPLVCDSVSVQYLFK
ncbi:MAG: DUF115 domain-containing protein [Gammaproteobacteria bacterium]|nr:DUF115 domain-containing protein [Gammaproteobacteria bacterium]